MTPLPAPVPAIAAAFEAACLAELDAIKPGNVHRFAAGHRMTVADFERSATVSAPWIAAAGLPVGRRVRLAARATAAAVGQNTNLGILLLAAPMALAAERGGTGDLGAATAVVLAALDVADAADAFAAIASANPAGLGRSDRHDVGAPAMVTLLAAMASAAGRDRIAWNYANGLADVFATGLPLLDALAARGWPAPWAATGVFMRSLAGLADSHIARKHGAEVAEAVRLEAAPLAGNLLAAGEPQALAADLLAFDSRLKVRGLNPGTSADLTVAVLFASALRGLR